MKTAAVNLAALGVDRARTPVVTRDQVKHAKPDPDLFLAAAERLNAPIMTAIVVGDSIWDILAATRCRALGVGLLSGGYGADEFGRQAHFASMRTLPICCVILTKLAEGNDSGRTTRGAYAARPNSPSSVAHHR